jgi:hypothetical protein
MTLGPIRSDALNIVYYSADTAQEHANALAEKISQHYFLNSGDSNARELAETFLWSFWKRILEKASEMLYHRTSS